MPDPEHTRTLHPLVLPERLCDPGNAELRRAVFVDVETTGLAHEHDEVIELAALPFTYTLDGRVVEVLHDEAQVHRNDPGRPRPEEITHLTGLTDDDLRGERIDTEAASALIERSGLVIAHNAAFDRPFVEQVLPSARNKPWACSRAEVAWTEERFASQALHCLLCALGVYARDRHRALADCEAGVWLLAQRLPVSGETVLAAMRRQALKNTVRLFAVGAPFESKDLLRARGYRWMPEMREAIERSWWTELEPELVDAELKWLSEQVYLRGAFRPLPARADHRHRAVAARTDRLRAPRAGVRAVTAALDPGARRRRLTHRTRATRPRGGSRATAPPVVNAAAFDPSHVTASPATPHAPSLAHGTAFAPGKDPHHARERPTSRPNDATSKRGRAPAAADSGSHLMAESPPGPSSGDLE